MASCRFKAFHGSSVGFGPCRAVVGCQLPNCHIEDLAHLTEILPQPLNSGTRTRAFRGAAREWSSDFERAKQTISAATAQIGYERLTALIGVLGGSLRARRRPPIESRNPRLSPLLAFAEPKNERLRPMIEKLADTQASRALQHHPRYRAIREPGS